MNTWIDIITWPLSAAGGQIDRIRNLIKLTVIFMIFHTRLPLFILFSKAQANRVPGLDKGVIQIPDDFDAPLPDDVLELFEK